MVKIFYAVVNLIILSKGASINDVITGGGVEDFGNSAYFFFSLRDL